MQVDRETFETAERLNRREFRTAYTIAAAFSVMAGVAATMGGVSWILCLVPATLWGCIASIAMSRADDMRDCLERWDRGER